MTAEEGPNDEDDAEHTVPYTPPAALSADACHLLKLYELDGNFVSKLKAKIFGSPGCTDVVPESQNILDEVCWCSWCL